MHSVTLLVHLGMRRESVHGKSHRTGTLLGLLSDLGFRDLERGGKAREKDSAWNKGSGHVLKFLKI